MTDAASDRLAAPLESSTVVNATHRCEVIVAGWVHGSRIVNWFLAEPDPEVIVIDLRETYTVGPFIRLLEWATTRGRRLAEATGLTRLAQGLSRRIESGPIRAFGVVLTLLAVAGVLSTVLAGGSNAVGGYLVLLGFGLLATRERRSADQLAESRIGTAFRAAFEPPAPTDRD